MQLVKYEEATPAPDEDTRPAEHAQVAEVTITPQAASRLDGIHKLLIVPLIGSNGVNIAATDKMIHELWNTGRFHVMQLQDEDGHFARLVAERMASSTKIEGEKAAASRPSLLSDLLGLGQKDLRGRTPVLEREVSPDTIILHKWLLETAKKQGADAILLGEVITYRWEDIHPAKMFNAPDSSGLVGMSLSAFTAYANVMVSLGETVFNKVERLWGGKPPMVKRVAQVQMFCRVLDLRDLSIRVSRDPLATEVAESEHEANLPLPEEVLRHALTRCVQEVVVTLAAPATPFRYQFMVTPSVEQGVHLAREGREQQAYQFFESVVADNPKDDAANYNMGLIEEARGNYVRASHHFNTAYMIGRSQLAYAALERIRQAIVRQHIRQTSEIQKPRTVPDIPASDVRPVSHQAKPVTSRELDQPR